MKSLLAILFSVLFFLPATKGQVGEIYGFLTDSKGNSLSDVLIKVYIGNRIYNGCFSEEDGMFSIRPLPSGSYTVEFSLNGFLKRKTTSVIVTSGSSVKINCKMIKGSSDSEIVTVYKMPKILPYYPLLYNNEPRIHCKIGSHNWPPSLSENVKMSRIQAPSTKPNYIYLSWSEQLKYNFNPRPNALKQINKSYSENDLKYIPFQHFLETLPPFQR